MKHPLCKEITLVDDCDAEMLEEFQVQLELVEAECAEVEFHPNYTTVKIIDNDGPEGNVLLMHRTHTPEVLILLPHPLTLEIVFRMLEPPCDGDERTPGEVFVPIQISISPIHAVLREDINVTVTAVGGTATGKQMCH